MDKSIVYPGRTFKNARETPITVRLFVSREKLLSGKATGVCKPGKIPGDKKIRTMISESHVNAKYADMAFVFVLIPDGLL